MRHVDYLLIGGGLAAARAAKQIRALDDIGEILMICGEPLLPYDRPPLSKAYLAGSTGLADIALESAATLAETRIACQTSETVSRLNPSAKTATLASGSVITFRKALIATGGVPIRPSIEGVNLDGIYCLRTAADADVIRSEALSGRRVVLVGGGFIGLEAAATLCSLGLDVTVIEATPRIWDRFDSDVVSSFVANHLEARGVRVLTGTKVTAFRGDGLRVTAAVTGAGEAIPCDMVCIGAGIRPETGLATNAGLDVDDGVVVDVRMQTSHTDIFAAGDVISYPDTIFGRRRRSEHWGHAEHSGQIAGRNMAGGDERYALLSYAWSDLFDTHIEFAGDIHGYDRQLVRGAPAEGRFMIIYLNHGRVSAYLAINVPAREYSVVRRMIQNNADMTGRESHLEDPCVSLRSLL